MVAGAKFMILDRSPENITNIFHVVIGRNRTSIGLRDVNDPGLYRGRNEALQLAEPVYVPSASTAWHDNGFLGRSFAAKNHQCTCDTQIGRSPA